MTTENFYVRGRGPARLRSVDLDRLGEQADAVERSRLARLARSSSYGKPAPALPVQNGRERILAEMDRAGIESVLLNHLWLSSSKRCACGIRSDKPAGQHYAWHAGHVAGLLTAAGFSAGWTK